MCAMQVVKDKIFLIHNAYFPVHNDYHSKAVHPPSTIYPPVVYGQKLATPQSWLLHWRYNTAVLPFRMFGSPARIFL